MLAEEHSSIEPQHQVSESGQALQDATKALFSTESANHAYVDIIR